LQFLAGIRQLRSELVNSISNEAVEILGINGQQSDFREGRIDKATHPDLIKLRTQNSFLGSGDHYLRSEQIVRVRMFLWIWLSLISGVSRDSELLLQVQHQLNQSSGHQDHVQTDLI
jgi:hypothetical protein